MLFSWSWALRGALFGVAAYAVVFALLAIEAKAQGNPAGGYTAGRQGAGVSAATPHGPGDVVVATVNGQPVLESEIKLAEAEIGSDLGTLPEATKRRVLVEYLIETQLMAEAAARSAPGAGNSFDRRKQYWRRRALRDAFFDKHIRPHVTDAEARRLFDAQKAETVSDIELRARHILVATKDKATEIFERIAHGASFGDMARQYSKDPGSRDNSGRLGTFTLGQMVPAFEEAVQQLKPGEVSLPVKTEFGWHLIQLDERRKRAKPDFSSVKKRIKAALIHQKARTTLSRLRAGARVEYHDPVIKAQISAERRRAQ